MSNDDENMAQLLRKLFNEMVENKSRDKDRVFRIEHDLAGLKEKVSDFSDSIQALITIINGSANDEGITTRIAIQNKDIQALIARGESSANAIDSFLKDVKVMEAALSLRIDKVADKFDGEMKRLETQMNSKREEDRKESSQFNWQLLGVIVSVVIAFISAVAAIVQGLWSKP